MLAKWLPPMPVVLMEFIEQYAVNDDGLIQSIRFLASLRQRDDASEEAQFREFTPRQLLSLSLALDGKNVWVQTQPEQSHLALCERMRQLFLLVTTDDDDDNEDRLCVFDHDTWRDPPCPFQVSTVLIDGTDTDDSRLTRDDSRLTSRLWRLQRYLARPLNYGCQDVGTIPSDAKLSARADQVFGGVQIICFSPTLVQNPRLRVFSVVHL